MTQPLSLNLTKTLDPADYVLLGEQLKIVDEHFESASPQHKMRRWEYAMALRAIHEWRRGIPKNRQLTALDVGGAGSPLAKMLEAAGLEPTVSDPKDPESVSIEDYAKQLHQHDIVTCISVIEHVKDVEPFLHALTSVVVKGGLLFLTMDYWGKDDEEEDNAMFHWMRERIYTLKSWRGLAGDIAMRGFWLFTSPDWAYHGDQVEGNYSFCSLTMKKEEERRRA